MIVASGFPLILIVLGGWMALGDAGASTPRPSLDAQRVRWSELEFRASKLGLTATSTVRLVLVPRARARSELLAVAGASVLGSAPYVAAVEIETVLRKRHSTIKAWFDASSGQAYQRRKLETGRKHYQRTDRLGAVAVQRRRRSPLDDSEIAAGPAGWNHREDEEVALPALPEGAVVTLPSTLFYLVAAARLDRKGDRLSLYAFSRQSIDRLELEVLGHARVATAFTVEGPGRTASPGHAGSNRTEVNGTHVNALCIAVRAEPVNADDSDASFRFLGLKGDVEIYLDPETRLPIQVSGSTGLLGRLDVKLKRAVLVGE